MPRLWRTAVGRPSGTRFLQDSVDSLPGTHDDRGILDLPAPDEPAAKGVIDRPGLEPNRKATLDEHVQECS